MSLLGITNPYLAAFAVGLSYGFVFCTSACLPYLASYIAGIGAGFREGIFVTLLYNSGRVTAYALIGAAIGLFKIILSDQILSSFQTYSSFAFAFVTIVIGVNILLKSRQTLHSCDNCVPTGKTNLTLNSTNRKFDFRAFSLGLSRGLIVCPPLLLLLVTYSTAFATQFDSLIVAILFGIGTALSPMLIVAGVTGWLLNKAPHFRRWISILGGVFLVVLGFSTLISAILVI
jgi:sulfite exporter TauE/SafE